MLYPGSACLPVMGDDVDPLEKIYKDLKGNSYHSFVVWKLRILRGESQNLAVDRSDSEPPTGSIG